MKTGYMIMIFAFFFIYIFLWHNGMSVAVLDNTNVSDKPFELIRRFRHNEELFTQGLQYNDDGYIIESSGLYDQSSLQIIDPRSGKIKHQVPIEAHYFAEGIVLIDNIIYMLTWREKKVLLYDGSSLKYIGQLGFQTSTGEGWGMTTNQRDELIVSDGSAHIRFFKKPTIIKTQSGTETYKVLEEELIQVREDIQVRNYGGDKDGTGVIVSSVNELEYIPWAYLMPVTAEVVDGIETGDARLEGGDAAEGAKGLLEGGDAAEGAKGLIFANVWYQDIIIVIRETDGVVLHTFDMSALYPKKDRRELPPPRSYKKADGTPPLSHGGRRYLPDCFNGIAFDRTNNTFLVTGKWWPYYYQVKLPVTDSILSMV